MYRCSMSSDGIESEMVVNFCLGLRRVRVKSLPQKGVVSRVTGQDIRVSV